MHGSLPRVTFSRGEQPIGKLPMYFGVNGEYVDADRAADEIGDDDHAIAA